MPGRPPTPPACPQPSCRIRCRRPRSVSSRFCFLPPPPRPLPTPRPPPRPAARQTPAEAASGHGSRRTHGGGPAFRGTGQGPAAPAPGPAGRMRPQLLPGRRAAGLGAPTATGYALLPRLLGGGGGPLPGPGVSPSRP